MKAEEYLQKVQERFKQSKFIPALQAEVFYEEKFEMKWFATKLKQFSFVSSVDTITLEGIRTYSEACVKYAIEEYKGLPRGFQNGVSSYSVLVSDKVDNAAIEFALSRPKKHFSAFEMPVIVDLEKQKIYYYQKNPIWGAIYYKHFRAYIADNFGI